VVVGGHDRVRRWYRDSVVARALTGQSRLWLKGVGNRRSMTAKGPKGWTAVVRKMYTDFEQDPAARLPPCRRSAGASTTSQGTASGGSHQPVANSVPNTQPQLCKSLNISDLPFKPRFGPLSPHRSSRQRTHPYVLLPQRVAVRSRLATKFAIPRTLSPPRTFARLISSTAL
jgi:hypothetical protein